MLANLGRSQEEAAVRTLMEVWLHGDLPAILPLLGGPTLPDVEVFRKGDTVYCPPWVIYSGPYQLTGPSCEQLAEALMERPPLLLLREILGQQVDTNRPHWLKLYHCRDSESGFDQGDCLLDYRQLEMGKKLLAEWPWPAVTGRHSFRQFLVLLPEGMEFEQAL